MRRLFRLLGLVAVLAGGGLIYSANSARTDTDGPPDMAPPEVRADRIVVNKSTRRLVLMRNGDVIRSFSISLGAAPKGHKTRQGDERTPEGDYVIDWRNAGSKAYLSLHISYPDTADIAAARAAGQRPGGSIMIHGLPNGWGFVGRLHLLWDWTDGCIAVTNAEMREIWALVPDGTPISITGGE